MRIHLDIWPTYTRAANLGPLRSGSIMFSVTANLTGEPHSFDEIIDPAVATQLREWDRWRPSMGVPRQITPESAIGFRYGFPVRRKVVQKPRCKVCWFMRLWLTWRDSKYSGAIHGGWRTARLENREQMWIFTTHGLVNGTAMCVGWPSPNQGTALVLLPPIYHAFCGVIFGRAGPAGCECKNALEAARHIGLRCLIDAQ